jgi:hypothetical protein
MKATLFIAAAVLVSGLCISSAQTAADEAADTDQTLIRSYEPSEMAKLRIDTLSFTDEAAICKVMRSSLGRFPSVALARALCKAIVVMQVAGDSREKAKDIAYQMMNIVEARGQKDDKAIYGTFNTVTKIHNGTGGHVTPKDLNVFLRSAGPMAKTLSDDGLISMATLIWEEKKDRGD